jgi:hypothetical protein
VSCAEDGASGGCWCGVRAYEPGAIGPGLLRLAQQQQVSQRSAWPSHAAPASERAGTFGSESVRFYGITGLSTESRHFGVIDTSVSTDPAGSIGGEFDPGSGSTLAACLMHASRARTLSGVLRGGRVRNTWATCPGVGDSRGKPRVIPHTFGSRQGISKKGSNPARGGACGRLAGWWGNGLPRR